MASPPPFPRIVISHLEHRAKATHYRQTQLHRLQVELVKSKDEIKAAIRSDVGHTPLEADFEYTLVLSELRQHYEALNPKNEVTATRQIELGNDNAGRYRNTSIVYVVPSTHTLLYSVLSPVCAAISAGSCVIVELPQTLRSLTSTLRRILLSSLDGDTFAISDSRPTDAELMQQFTLVLQSQPEDFPKARRTCISPSSMRALAIVDRTAAIDEAAQAVVRARFSRSGSSPYAPDAVLVNEFIIEEFIARLLHYMSPYMAQENGSIKGDSSKHKPRKQYADSQRILDTAEKSEDLRVVIRGSNGSIISVHNRSNPLLNQKINGPILIIHAVSSLDDGIDFTSQSQSTLGNNTVAANFIFAALPEANYLANFIDAKVACVNHIPAELLVGPLCPAEDTPSLSPRYTRIMFEDPRPQLLHKTTLTKLVETAYARPSDTRLAELKRTVTAPLPAMDRKKGREVDFFIQALMTGATAVLVPVLVGAGVLVKYGLPYLRQRV